MSQSIRVCALVAGLFSSLPAAAQLDLAARLATYAPLMMAEHTVALSDAGPMQPPDPAIVERASLAFARILPAALARYPNAALSTVGLTVTTATHISAYALPGGHVVLSTGLVTDLDLTDSELAAVLAHEFSHACVAHGASHLAWVEAHTKPGREAHALVDDFSRLIWDSPELQAIARNDEFDADAEAVGVLADAGYDPRALISLLNQVIDAYGNGEGVAHPAPGARIERLRGIMPARPPSP
jgi:predicted Zn-dependent protease